MKMQRSLAARMHSFKLTVVRRSSSMIPSLTVLRGKPRSSSTRVNTRSVKATSSGPCCLGLTTYTEPVRELRWAPSGFLRSCIAAATVISASTRPSGTSRPVSAKRTASVSKCIPTLRTKSTTRPGRTFLPPDLGHTNVLSGLSLRTRSLPPLENFSSRVPFMRPVQLLYTLALSKASTAATESSQSAIAVIADSITMSLMPAAWVAPMVLDGLI
mmetsp:Transcript_4772/g.8484  ORF Transcript_4772/g.8484 Transcript_4772/m.8484 type:complete len:215 (-) Transcript_4772:827-1471(-)